MVMHDNMKFGNNCMSVGGTVNFSLSHRICNHTYDAKIFSSLISHDTQQFV